MFTYCHVSIQDDTEIADAAREGISMLLGSREEAAPMPKLTVERTDEGVLVRVAK